ncbi:MAG: hypothetical protein LUG98_00140 [Tannerellaceae bacterium]|nr:hypothetical protein [Tannerellaceae bacterium]
MRSKKYTLILIIYAIIFVPVFAQQVKEGRNSDPYQTAIGEPPYEMKGRTEEFPPFLTFNDCSEWTIRSTHAEAALYRTRQERVWGEYSGRIVYTTHADDAGFDLLLKEPRLLAGWNCIEVWTWGDHWCWEENPASAMDLYVILIDGKGKEHRMNMVQAGYEKLQHKYWFLNHFRLPAPLQEPVRFAGYGFSCAKPDIGETHSIYLGNSYLFKEEYIPVAYTPLPDKLPFPLRPETIAPLCKQTDGVNQTEHKEGKYYFSYTDAQSYLCYEVDPVAPFAPVSLVKPDEKVLLNQGAGIVFENEQPEEWTLLGKELRQDTLFLDWQATGEDFQQPFRCAYTIHNKSLVWIIEELADKGRVAEVRVGETQISSGARLEPVPFLVYNYGYERPNLLYSGGYFFFSMFDWYYTNASAIFPGRNTIQNGTASYNGGVRYIPLLDDRRNPLRERLFINVSEDIHEVFPTVDNPGSPAREGQADRAWLIGMGSNLKLLSEQVATYRFYGMDKVSVRYHEEFWRKDGESFTFRLEPNPELGTERLKEFVRFVKSKDWRIGFYTNYTDLSPVSKQWNRDWVKVGPKGEWQVSWSRTYSPKPHIAWEQQAYFAPRVQQLFGTNHSYCDVHTAVPPMSRVDYHPYSPGAGKLRSVFEYYGMLLLNERRSYPGPIYSEGMNHWWYAGLVDGNYGNGWLEEVPVFPDFQLLKIHPLQMDAGCTGEEDAYLAYAFAYGHIAQLHYSLPVSLKRYAMLQPLQTGYAMIPVEEILYSDGEQFYTPSEAFQKGLVTKESRLKIRYQSGLEVYVSFSPEGWTFSPEGCILQDKTVHLSRYGFYASHPAKGILSCSVTGDEKGTRLDKVYSPELFYLDSHDQQVEGDLAGKGVYLIKKEKFNWEVIPLEGTECIEFDLALPGLENYGIDIHIEDREGNWQGRINSEPVTGRVRITPVQENIKYHLIPVTKR